MSGSEALVTEDRTRPVSVLVTADVLVTCYDSGLSSDGGGDPKVEIVTSLNAIFKKPDEDIHSENSVVEFHNGPAPNASHNYDQPFIRRSKKCTTLNVSPESKPYSLDKPVQIERTFILPYVGCSKRDETLKSSKRKDVSTKTSKSWVIITKTSSKNVKSRSFHILIKKLPSTKGLSDQLGTVTQDSELSELYYHSYKEQELFRCNQITEELPGQTNSDTKLPINNESDAIYQMHMRKRNFLPGGFYDESTPKENIYRFKPQTLPPISSIKGVSQPKSKRNVSILHRPRTRNKATSTTSLNIEAFQTKGQTHNHSIVKLERKSVDFCQTGSPAPVTNAQPNKKKKKQNIFRCCFSTSNKNEAVHKVNNYRSDSGGNAVYLPSIVNMHKNR